MTEARAVHVQLCPFTSGSPELLEGAHNAAVAEGGPERGHFFAVVEVHGPAQGRETVAEDLAAILESAYLEAPGGVTSALRASLEEANRYLLQRNRERPAEARFLAGASCLVLRDEDAYVAQAGPAALFVRSRGEVQRFPSRSAWLDGDWPDELEQLYLSPLGLHAHVPVDLFHYPTDMDDRVLLATSGLARLADAGELEQILEAPSARLMAERVCALAGETEVSGLALRSAPSLEEEAPLPLESLSEQPDPRASHALADAEAGTTGWQTAPPGAEEDGMPALEENLQGYLEEETRPRRRYGGESPLAGLLKSAVAFLGTALGFLLRLVAALAAAVGRLAARLLPVLSLRAREALRVWLPRLLPGDGDPTLGRALGPEQRSSHRRYLAVALAVPLLLALLVVTSRLQYQRSREARFEALMAQAEHKLTSAAALSEAAALRGLLGEAEADVRSALALKPSSEEARSLHLELISRLDELNAVTRVVPTPLVRLEEGQPLPRRVVVRGIDLYVLDQGTHRVYKWLLDSSGGELGTPVDNPVLMRKGDERENIVVQDLVDITWLPAGGGRTRSDLAILDRAGHLLEYDPSRGIFLVPLAATEVWRKPQLLAGHQGSLYLLDPHLNQVLKYDPQPAGYPLPPTYALNPEAGVDLSGAVDMAVDGDIYVLLADGRILKFQQGNPVEFRLRELPQPLERPVALFLGATTLYLADAGLGAVIRLSKEGTFLGQLRPPHDGLSLEGLTAFHVDEGSGRLYLVVGDQVFTATFSAG